MEKIGGSGGAQERLTGCSEVLRKFSRLEIRRNRFYISLLHPVYLALGKPIKRYDDDSLF